ncbi:MAG TPA: helix-turn-helix transcriptional regulator, partial [Candidatus Nitrosotenuis sp.]|nr:helix-turn-helix transcriptional regulator [Candidatus Nitrosotenuis sp.]
RLAARLTQEQLAARIGCSPDSIYCYESGRRRPRERVLRAIARITRTSYAWFLEAPRSELDGICRELGDVARELKDLEGSVHRLSQRVQTLARTLQQAQASVLETAPYRKALPGNDNETRRRAGSR